MKNFLEFITESRESTTIMGKNVNAVPHTEDYVFRGTHDHIALSDMHLDEVNKALLGKKSKVDISQKFDGTPIIFGNDPKTKRFFVSHGVKAQNLNYSHEDIDKNHKGELNTKLKAALDHLPKITAHGVYHGELMHTKDDVKTKNGVHSITPGETTYSAPKGSVEGESMKKKLGVVVHSQYKGGKDLANMQAEPLDAKTRANFRPHPDVNNIDPTVRVNPKNYTPAEQKEFFDHVENAKKSYSRMKSEAPDAIANHGPALERYVNATSKTMEEPSVKGFMSFLTDRHSKVVDKDNMPDTTTRKIHDHANSMKHISENGEHFKQTLELHKHLQGAKNVLANVLSKNSSYAHSVNGVPVHPSHVVVDRDKNASKIVNRKS